MCPKTTPLGFLLTLGEGDTKSVVNLLSLQVNFVDWIGTRIKGVKNKKILFEKEQFLSPQAWPHLPKCQIQKVNAQRCVLKLF